MKKIIGIILISPFPVLYLFTNYNKCGIAMIPTLIIILLGILFFIGIKLLID